jgi:hypothetical protein
MERVSGQLWAGFLTLAQLFDYLWYEARATLDKAAALFGCNWVFAKPL